MSVPLISARISAYISDPKLSLEKLLLLSIFSGEAVTDRAEKEEVIDNAEEVTMGNEDTEEDSDMPESATLLVSPQKSSLISASFECSGVFLLGGGGGGRLEGMDVISLHREDTLNQKPIPLTYF